VRLIQAIKNAFRGRRPSPGDRGIHLDPKTLSASEIAAAGKISDELRGLHPSAVFIEAVRRSEMQHRTDNQGRK